MTGKLCIMVCESYKDELQAVVEREMDSDVKVLTFPTCHCRWFSKTCKFVGSLPEYAQDFDQIHVVGGNCCAAFQQVPQPIRITQIHQFERCLEILLGRSLIEDYQARGYYLLSPYSVKHWQECIKSEWEGDQAKVQNYFHAFVKCFLLLDTKLDPNIDQYREEFARFVGLPSEKIAVGTDVLSHIVKNIRLQWHLGKQQRYRDIVELEEAKERERVLKKRFRTLFNASPAIMTITTLDDGTYVDVNDSFTRVMGYTREELVGLTTKKLSIIADPEQKSRLNAKFAANGRLWNEEVAIRTKSGAIRIGLLSAELIELNNQRCVLSAYQDITELKKLQQDMARFDRLNLVGEMAAAIAHEIRNPMTTVRGFLQILGEKAEFSKYKEFFDLMIDEMERANSIITEFLSLAKDKALAFKSQNLNNVIKAMYPLIEADTFTSNMDVIWEQGNIPDLLLDEKEIRQLIFNLVRNGLEAMEPGGTLRIRTYCENNKVVLSVQDEGKGINQEIIDRLGTPFLTTKEQGTGLGLAVCYQVAARHNASIRFKTSPTGTTFYVEFPVNSSRTETAAKS